MCGLLTALPPPQPGIKHPQLHSLLHEQVVWHDTLLPFQPLQGIAQVEALQHWLAAAAPDLQFTPTELISAEAHHVLLYYSAGEHIGCLNHSHVPDHACAIGLIHWFQQTINLTTQDVSTLTALTATCSRQPYRSPAQAIDGSNRCQQPGATGPSGHSSHRQVCSVDRQPCGAAATGTCSVTHKPCTRLRNSSSRSTSNSKSSPCWLVYHSCVALLGPSVHI